MKVFITAVLLCASLTSAAQTTPKSSAASRASAAKKSVPVRTECVAAVGLCVAIPSMWQRLGNVFGDLGFVVAEPHPGVDSATWPQLTVAAIDVPAAKTGSQPPTLDSLVNLVLAPDGTFTSSETQQRSRLLLNGANAQLLRVKLHDENARDASQADTIEEVALIESGDGLVYSIALRCAPEALARVEPVFQKAIHSWRVTPPAEQPAPAAKPAEDPSKK